MRKVNLIAVYSQKKDTILFCKRTSNPYKYMYNLVGGKVEDGETGEEAAKRELEEETGIGEADIRLEHIMDFTYYRDPCIVEVYAGGLNKELELVEEKHPLFWHSVHSDFFDRQLYAGEGHMGHILIHTGRYIESII